MLSLILSCAALALVWLARRYWLLSQGVKHLAAAAEQKRPFLSEDNRLANIHPSWKRLAAEINRLVQETSRLSEQRAGQLSQLETALRNLQEAILVVDRNNYIVLANKALQTIFPQVEHILGQRLEVVLRSADFLAYLEEVRGGKAASRREIQFFGPNGTTWVEATGVFVSDSSDSPGPWLLFVLHEITKQKQLESVQREFVANVSHELKTPLSVIKGYAETLVDDHRDMPEAERAQFIRTIHRHAERLAALVEDLLTLSRLESGNPGIRSSAQDLAPFLRSMVQDYAGPLAGSGHQFELVMDVAARIVADFDPSRLTQVVDNLIENARKYTPAGTRVELGARADPAAGMVEVWVRDNGPGIPQADLPRIFERFYRVEKGRSRERGGTGLGLSIVKHIIQLHGGRVWAESPPGEGTRIAFTLPMRTPARVGEDEPAAVRGFDRIAKLAG